MRTALLLLSVLTSISLAQTNVAPKPKQVRTPQAVQAIAPDAIKPEIVSIKSLGRKMGHQECHTDKGTILIANLPIPVVQYLQQVKAGEDRIAAAQAKLARDARAARTADATASTGAGGDPAWVEAKMAERRRANLMAVDVENQSEDLDAMIAAQEKLVALEGGKVMAVLTPQKYATLPIWRYVGPVVKKKE